MSTPRRPRRLVILCDGTGNQIASAQSNVLRLYQVLKKSTQQRVYYDPGIGTVDSSEDWIRWKANTERVLGLVTGYGLDTNVLNAYQFLLSEYKASDELYFFGFSRGAYTVRVLAGFINAIGLLHTDQQHLQRYAFGAYKRISEDGRFDNVRLFERILRPRRPPIKFLGLWDSVSTILVPRSDRLYLPARRQLAYTARNPSVEIVCHALAVDERRRMFRPYLWSDGQEYWGGPFKPKDSAAITAQKTSQVWFPGVHSDVGGGYPEQESGLAKLSLQWMVEQLNGLLEINQATFNRIVLGESKTHVAPDAMAPMHNSMNRGWHALEYLPKMAKHKEFQKGREPLGCYLPLAEPRCIPAHTELHKSVRIRMVENESYRPENVDCEA